MSECVLSKWDRCCCKCKFRLKALNHDTFPIGWACIGFLTEGEDVAYIGDFEHGMCELYMPRQTNEKWTVRKQLWPDGDIIYLVQEKRRVIAYVPDQGMAHLIAQLPRLKELRYDWAVIINHLANIALDGAGSNERDYAQEMIEMVAPFLDGASIVEGDK